jgi:methionine-rich copper-binding protein CopC
MIEGDIRRTIRAVRGITVAFVAAAAWFACAPAAAHAFLDHALPAVGSTVHESPRSVRLSFTEELEPAFSRVRVEDAAGKEVDAGDSRVDPGDRSVLTAGLPALPPGKYRVVWRVVSVDTHVTEGDFTFEIKP